MTRVMIDPGPAQRTVVVPALADEAAAAGPVPVAAIEPAPPPASRDAEPATNRGGTQRAIGWVALGVGVLAAGGGAFFGVQTLSKKSTVDEHCAGANCDAAGLRANDDAKNDATLSTIAFAVGGVALVTGIVLLISAPSSRRGDGSALRRGLRGVW